MKCLKKSQDGNNSAYAFVTVLAGLFVLGFALSQPAQAQQYNVIHEFTGEADGDMPGELTMDRAGNLYGSAQQDLRGEAGVVFEMKALGAGWIFAPLYTFQGQADGSDPGPVIFGPDGNLYGATQSGGSCQSSIYGCGTVFKLSPPPSSCRAAFCAWRKTNLYDLAGGMDGAGPVGPLAFGPDGSIYGVTRFGGAYGDGTVYKLTPANGGWTESVLHAFAGGNDGIYPSDGVTLDQAGNLYGVTEMGGSNLAGVVYEVSPSGAGWTEAVLHVFGSGSDGDYPLGGLIFDASGNLYGTTASGPGNGGGVAFTLTPGNAGWTETLLYTFAGEFLGGPAARLSFDSAGNLYGTTYADPPNGSVFKLAHVGGAWIETDMHLFDQGLGEYPNSNVLMDANGNLYGSTMEGGNFGNHCNSNGCGVVWEITP